VTTTLGTKQDAQHIDGFTEDFEKTFLLHYNFPPFSTGEVKPLRGASRRETGHGHLAERAISRVLPSETTSPTPSGWSPRSSSPTAARRWPRCAAASSR
jgi:polyribonucleotide nucleotidyltransferase